MTENECTELLSGGLFGGRILVFDSLESTNHWAMANLAACEHGDVVCAIRQTAGVGRFSREWLAPEDRALALSVILRGVDGSCVGQVAALAVREAIKRLGIEAALKWPNDVLVNGRKIAGILAEKDSDGGAIVLGIGLNVNVTSADLAKAGLASIATSMLLEVGTSFEVEKVRSEVVSSLDSEISGLAGSAGFAPLVARWSECDFLAGSEVALSVAGQVITGQYAGIDAQGRLLLRDEAGTEHVFWSGDIEKLRVSSA